ncbi:MAG: Na(+)/H(+) antiporter subunit D [Pseudodesulfovibrio sp.]|nr:MULTISPECIES: Na(+)/H(+) antiporter subunit D [Pseudodesulfovibrio]MBU4515924.1 Na(+)/H(+) antiporter subunit D [Pseudomonadota bacterium]MBU4522874.1 Na(+)/H(+) antiporter subunit D [Pseudomonadota bacterium]MBU4559998.1 Na(+)/H(+) antiporter subunit D [Pseudomonadota bacterium]MBV1766285.1 Na(+)/H(+) antiporter subunit D [Pseudodesulfovibrio sp.]MBV1772419.1 Na(+)/H(+) antiporter subunit D [Pseudodesulfovibrio sp.]
MMTSIHPILAYLGAAALLPLFTGAWRNRMVLAAAAVGLLIVHNLPSGTLATANFLGMDLVLMRVDGLSRVFGYIFCLNSVFAFLFAYKLNDVRQQLAALFYIGSALGAVFAGDLITLYVFWEIMAIASTFLILARKTKLSSGAGFRYVLVHLFGGLCMLVGIIVHIQTTGSIAFTSLAPSLGSWLILLGVLVNASAFPFASWLSDSYPEATVTGGVILSAYTTKTAVYALLRAFPGWEILIVIGCLMAVYGIIYALLENDMRRILAYSITNQVGFMVTGAGIGTAMAINGAAAHAFCHIIYKSLLWMSAGAVLAATGKSKCTELGGLHKTMPLTLLLGLVGALAISSFPGTSGFTSKSMIIQAAANEHLTWVLMILEIASAGVFLHAGIKFPYFVFFAKDKGLRPPEAPRHMLLAMAGLAFLCIALGVYPQPLYAILPFDVGGFDVYKGGKVVAQLQLLLFSALVFFLMLPLLKRTDTIALETDWFYRRGGRLFYQAVSAFFNGLNDMAAKVAGRAVHGFAEFCRNLPERALFLLTALNPDFWTSGTTVNAALRMKQIRDSLDAGALPVGGSLIAVTLGLAVLLGLVL